MGSPQTTRSMWPKHRRHRRRPHANEPAARGSRKRSITVGCRSCCGSSTTSRRPSKIDACKLPRRRSPRPNRHRPRDSWHKRRRRHRRNEPRSSRPHRRRPTSPRSQCNRRCANSRRPRRAGRGKRWSFRRKSLFPPRHHHRLQPAHRSPMCDPWMRTPRS